jgi:hypothetical protein
LKRVTKQILICGLSVAALLVATGWSADPPHPLGIFNGVPPSTGPAIVDGELTEQQARDKIAALWNQQDQNGQPSPHGLWVDRKGVIVAAGPTTAPVDDLLSPTLVSVHLNNVQTRKAISDFGKQTGVKLAMIQPEMWRGRSFPAVTMDGDKIPLLEAVNEFSCKTGLATAGSNNGWAIPPSDPAHPRIPLTLQQDNRSLGPWEVFGPFAFEVQQISHSIALNQDPANSPIQLMIEMQHEPRLVLLGKDQNVAVDEAVDDKGNKLGFTDFSQGQPRKRGLWSALLTGGSRAQPVQQPIYWAPLNQPFWVNLQCPASPGKSIAKFRAHTHILVQSQSETLEAVFADKDAVVEKTIAGIKCKVGPISTPSSQQTNCSVQFTRDTMDPAAWSQIATALQSVSPRMLDDNGTPFPNMQLMGGNTQGDVVQANFYWYTQSADGQSPRPAKLVLDVPTKTRTVEVPIQFDNLPLP